MSLNIKDVGVFCSLALMRCLYLVFSPERGAKRRVQGKMRFICGNDAACLGAGWDGPEGQTFSYGCCGQKFLVCLLEKGFVSDFSSFILEFV